MHLNRLWNYYYSFYKIFIKNGQVESRTDLYFWDWYILFMLWNKTIPHKTGKQCFQTYHDLDIIPKARKVITMLGRYFLVFQALVLSPIFCVFSQDVDFWHWLQYPDSMPMNFFGSTNSVSYEKLPQKYKEAFTSIPSAFASFCYFANLTQKLHLHEDKQILHEFCVKNNIPTIKCLESKTEILDYIYNKKITEFIIKESEGSYGINVKLTKDPLSFLKREKSGNYADSIVIQPRLHNHSSIIQITNNSNCLCTFRLTTYNKQLNQMGNKAECFLKCQTNKSKLVDNRWKSESVQSYWCDIANETVHVTKEVKASDAYKIIPALTLFEVVDVAKTKICKHSQLSYKIAGLKHFAAYLESIHWKYWNELPGIGWDVTKVTDGKWVIVEANTIASYYPMQLNYCQNLFKWHVATAGYNFTIK